MKYQLECPVCEQRFAVDSESAGKTVKCPGCSRSFKLPSKKKAVDQPPPAATSTSSPAKPLPAPLPLAKPIAPAPADDQLDQPKISEPSGIRTNKPSSMGMAAAKQKRKKQKMVRGIATILGLTIIVGILAGFLVMRLSKDANQVAYAEPDLETQSPDQEVQNSDSNVSTKAPSTGSSSSAAPDPVKPKAPKPEKKIVHEDLAPQKYVFHESKQVDESWDSVYKHLVTLTIHNARGTHKAVGTIVDSRGWILTSYSAIKGASKIEASSGYKTIDQFYQPPALSDSVRGVITTDPEQDLAVLSVNRRFVVSFADVAITEKDFVVEGEFMLQSGPPTPKNVYACYESKIAISGKFDDLAKKSQAIAKSKQLTSKTLPWLVCPDHQKAIPGAPLVRINGTIEAIHVFSIDDQAHYVPVHLLNELLSSANDQPQPLSVLRDPSGVENGSSEVAVDVDHPIRKTSVQLNRLVKLCEQFNWVATNKSQYGQLQKFSRHFVTALNYVKENKESEPELTGDLQTQLEQVKKSIASGLSKAKPASVKAMNKFAAADLKKPNQVVPFYGSVIELEVSAGKDVLQLDRTKPSANVALNRDESRDRFNRGDICMAFVKVPAQIERTAYSIRDRKVVAVVVDMITRIDVSK